MTATDPGELGPRPGERTYEIRQVADLTGLTTSCLRAWERRFALVRPERQPNGYRAYSSRQVALLRAYARLTRAGSRIGDLARRPWRDVVIEGEQTLQGAGGVDPELLQSVLVLDRDRLTALVRGEVERRGLAGFASRVAVPLAQVVGDLWAIGILPVVAEHLASEIVVQALKAGLGRQGNGPLVLAASLPNERHEWGLLSTLAEVQDAGWRVHYLGPDLPLTDLLHAAWKVEPARVAISVSDSARITEASAALSEFPRRLPPSTTAIIGGSGIATLSRRLADWGFDLGTGAGAITTPAATHPFRA